MIRTLYIYWAQGFLVAPLVVKKCLLSWKTKNQGWTIIELDDTNLGNYLNLNQSVPGIDEKQISDTARSDIIRICLLKKYGGLWCDATTFCNIPLDDWLPQYI